MLTTPPAAPAALAREIRDAALRALYSREVRRCDPASTSRGAGVAAKAHCAFALISFAGYLRLSVAKMLRSTSRTTVGSARAEDPSIAGFASGSRSTWRPAAALGLACASCSSACLASAAAFIFWEDLVGRLGSFAVPNSP